MKGQKKPTWLRWLMLAVALGLCWTVWSEMQEYARLGEQAIFSETEWTELLSGRGFVWVVRGIMIFLFLYQFIVWNRSGHGRTGALWDGIALSLLALLWIGLYWLLIPGGMRAVWLLFLVLLLGGAGWFWWKYFKLQSKAAAGDGGENSPHV